MAANPENDSNITRITRESSRKLPEDLITDGGDGYDGSLGNNPRPSEHEPTFTRIQSVSGELVVVATLTCVSHKPREVNGTAQRRKAVRAPELWTTGQPEATTQTHAIRVLSVLSEKVDPTDPGCEEYRLVDGPTALLRASGLPVVEAGKVVKSLQDLAVLKTQDKGGETRWLVDRRYSGVDSEGHLVPYSSKTKTTALQGNETPAQPAAVQAEAEVDLTKFHIGRRPVVEKQSDRHDVLTRALEALRHMGQGGEVDEGWLRFVPERSGIEVFAGLTGTLAAGGANNILLDLKIAGLLKEPKKLKGKRGYEWSVDNTVECVTVEDVERVRQEHSARRRALAKRAGGVSLNATAKVIAAETEPTSDNRFAIPNRERFIEQADRDEILTTVLEAMRHIAGDVEPNEEGNLIFTVGSEEGQLGFKRQLQNLIEAAQGTFDSVYRDMSLLGLVEYLGIAWEDGKAIGHKWAVNGAKEKVTKEDVTEARRLKGEALSRLRAKAGAVVLNKTVTTVAVQPEAPVVDDVVPSSNEDQISAEEVDVARVIERLAGKIESLGARVTEGDRRVEELTDALAAAEETILARDGEIEQLKATIAGLNSAATISVSSLPASVRAVLKEEQNS